MNETATEIEPIIKSAWREQAVWSATANSLKAELVKWRNFAAIAGVLGATLETLAASMAYSDGNWLWLRGLVAISGAVVLAIIPFVLKTKASKEHVNDWIRARSISEALKETIYRYLIRAPPFKSESGPSDLIKKCQDLKNKVQDLCIFSASIEPQEKEHPLALTIDSYIECRVTDQIERYYIPKSRENARASKQFHNLEFGLSLLAVIMGTAVSASVEAQFSGLLTLAPWIAVVTTASAAITAHIASSRYDHQARIFYSTADRLAGLRDEWLANPNRNDLNIINEFVNNCEHAISTENESWLAEWTREQNGK